MPIRVGIIGCGFAGCMHGLAYQPHIEAGNVKMIAACDIEDEIAAKMAKEYEMDAHYTKWQELIKRKDIDAVSICLPHYMHDEVTVAAARSGKHVLCEKPMATTLQGCDNMIKAAREANVKLMIAETYRFMPSMVKIKDIVDSGKIGEVFFARGSECLNEVPTICDPESWHCTPDKAGGGVWFDAGVHICSAFRYVLGDLESVRAGLLEHVATKEKEDDNAIVLMKFKKGAAAEAFLSETIGSPQFIRFEFFGTEGTILMDTSWDQPIRFFSSKGESPSEEWEKPEVEHLPMNQFYTLSFREEVKEFVACILKDREPEYRGEEGKVAVEMDLMGVLSARNGKAVRRDDLYSPEAKKFGIK